MGCIKEAGVLQNEGEDKEVVEKLSRRRGQVKGLSISVSPFLFFFRKLELELELPYLE